tara:strand:- start:63 stop:176 length:114 start_codon:yes stop_codon:yes gene_type:complete
MIGVRQFSLLLLLNLRAQIAGSATIDLEATSAINHHF